MDFNLAVAQAVHQTAKFNSCQIFRLYGNSVIITSLITFASLIDYSVFNIITLISTPVTLGITDHQ